MASEWPRRTSKRQAVARYLTLLVISCYPFSITYGAFAGVESLDPYAMERVLSGSMAIALLLFWALRVVIRDQDARAQWIGTFILGCGTYPIAVHSLFLLGFSLPPNRGILALVYTVALCIATSVLIAPWRRRPRDMAALAIIGGVLVGAGVYRGVSRWLFDPRGRWQGVADSLAEEALRPHPVTRPPRHDIYYVVLDAFGRADTLNHLYGLDSSPFVDYLKSRGFFVADRARSNYAQTLLSFSSLMNLDYLDSVAAAAGKNNETRSPLAYLIQHNALMRLAKQAGYEVVGVGSDYGPTKRFDEVDSCICRQIGLDLFEQSVIAKTPLAPLVPDRWSYGAHRDKILESLDALEHDRGTSKPRFVFVHIIAPHPPFTFAPDGSFRRPDRPFSLNEGSAFQGPREEYVRGYRDQAEFVINRMRTVIESLLNRPGPTPAIVFHGDHGPGSMLDIESVAGSNLAERMNIFAAYYFPESGAAFYPSMTPISGARILANQYFGTALPSLPDGSWFSTWSHPFDFVKVSSEPPVRTR